MSDRNEKLQVTLTRSLSVQDGLDEMMNWMKMVEKNVGEDSQVPLDSAAIADALSREAVCCFFSPIECYYDISIIAVDLKKFYYQGCLYFLTVCLTVFPIAPTSIIPTTLLANGLVS